MIWCIVIDCLDLPAEQVIELAADLRDCARKHDPKATSYTLERWRHQQAIRPPEPPLLAASTQRRHVAEHEHRTPSRRRGSNG